MKEILCYKLMEFLLAIIKQDLVKQLWQLFWGETTFADG